MAEISSIEKLWYSRSKLTWVLLPASLFFLLLVKLKRWLYQLKILPTNNFSKPVLVVGNLTVGGTGKTPFIVSLVSYLKKQNIETGIVSRGYGCQTTDFPHQIVENDNAADVGDEAFMLFSKLGVPVVIDPNRSRAVNKLLDNNEIDLVISDDGLQHYQMNRDIEVLMFDGNRQFGNQLVLPFGPLREPVSRLKNVDFVIQNGNCKNIYSSNNAIIEPSCFVNLESKKEVPLSELQDKSVRAIAAIGNPTRFFSSLEDTTKVTDVSVFNDHHLFVETDFAKFSDNDTVVMTEKDATKCYSFAKPNWFYLKVEMKLEDSLLDALKSKIELVLSNYHH